MGVAGSQPALVLCFEHQGDAPNALRLDGIRPPQQLLEHELADAKVIRAKEAQDDPEVLLDRLRELERFLELRVLLSPGPDCRCGRAGVELEFIRS